MNTTNENPTLQQALSDIALIRQVLNKTDQDQVDSKLVGITLDANVLLQAGAFFCVLTLCLVEIFSGHTLTQTLISGSQFEEMRTFGIGFMGSILIVLLILMYFILWRAARHNGEDVKTYIARNFKYVNNLSFISDLLMKFIAISLILLAGKPEWVAPLLVAFTGDYLLQNRFFTLSTKMSVILGIFCIVVALSLFSMHSSALFIPLLVFTAISGLSVTRLILRYKTLETADE